MKYLNGKKQAEWTINNINRILSDEKYCGLVILQKTVTKDFLSHKQLKNDGLEQQYVIENHHEGIISKEDFEYVKMLRKRNSDTSTFRYEACASPFAGIFFCRDCHRPMVKISTHAVKRIPAELTSIDDFDFRQVFPRAIIKSKDYVFLVMGNPNIEGIKKNQLIPTFETSVDYKVRKTIFKCKIGILIKK